MSINVLVLVGHAGRDPELRFFESGSCVCEFTLAVNRLPKDGQPQEPLWLSCKAWGKTAQAPATTCARAARSPSSAGWRSSNGMTAAVVNCAASPWC